MDKRRVILNRIEILEVLGEGETARVYRARDHVLKREVAVKEFTRERSRGEDAPIRREVKFLSQLDHPSLVKIFDLIVEEEGGRSFLVEELVGGQDAGRFIGTASWEERWLVLIEILRGLEYLHQRGIIHLDIKPSNVLVSGLRGRGAGVREDSEGVAEQEPGVKILDFGLAEDIRRFQEKKVLSGTFPYIAPEVIRGDPVDGRADLYSLGMLVWEAIREGPLDAGKPLIPSTESLEEEIRKTLSRKPPAGADFPAGTPPAFREVIITLLQPDPRERFHSANHAVQKINKRLQTSHPLEPGRLRLPDKTTSVLAGRRREVSELKRHFNQFVGGAGFSSVTILGERDSGKSALLGEVKRWAQTQGFHVVDISLPGEGVPEILDRLILPGDESRFETCLSFLKRVLPARFAEAPDAEPLGSNPADEQARIKDKLAEALSIAFGRRPVVLLVDDMADRRDIGDLLSHCFQHHLDLASDPDGSRKVLLVLAARAESDLPAGIPAGLACELRPWSREEIREVVRNLLAVDSVPERVVRAIHEQTEGIPGMVVERLRVLAERSLRPGEDIEAQLEAVSVADIESPEALPSHFQEAFAGRSKSERRLLSWLSLSARESTLQEIAEIDPELRVGLGFALRRLSELGWVRVGTRGYRVAGDMRRDIVLGALHEDERRSMYGRLAERIQGDRDGSVLGASGVYFRSGDVLRGFALARPELRLLLRVNQPERALRFLESHLEAANALPGAENRSYRRLLGEAYLGVADFQKAIRTIEPLTGEPRDAEDAGELRLILARAYRFGGHLDKAVQTIRSARQAQGTDSTVDPSIDALLADILLEQANYEEAAQIAGPYLAGQRPCADDERCAFRHAMAKVHFYRREHDSAVSLFRRNCEETEQTGRLARHALSLNSLAAALIYAGRPEEALPHLHSCLAISHEVGDLRTFGLAHANLAAAHVESRLSEKAAEHYEKAVATFRKISDKATEARTLYNLGVLRAESDDWSRAEDALEESIGLAREHGMPHLEGRARLELGECHQRRGSVERAFKELEHAESLFRKVESEEDVLFARLKKVDLGLGREPSEILAVELGKCEQSIEGRTNPKLDAWCKYLHGLLLFDKDPARCRSHLESALDTLRGSPKGDSNLEKRILERLAGLSPAPAAAATYPPLSGDVPQARGGSDTGVERGAGGTVDGVGGLGWLDIAQKINSAMDVQDVLTEIVDSLVAFTHAERGFLLLKEEGDLTTKVARARDKQDLNRAADAFSQTLAEDTMETKRLLVTLDAMSDPRFQGSQSVHELQLRSVVCVPLLLENEALGVLYFDNRLQSGRFGEQHAPALKALGNLAAMAIHKSQVIARSLRDQRDVRRVARDLRHAKERIEQLNKELEEANRKLQEKLIHQGEELEAVQRRLEVVIGREQPKYQYDRIVGTSRALKRTLLMVDRAVESALPVLILGESGTGKELIAKAIHFNSRRKRKAFIPLNCGAMPEDLFESELFGYVKGAFTGAERDRAGLFEVADGGTLFLDEVGDLPLGMQPKLLRVLQDGSIRRVGGSKETGVDVRVIAATNQDLKDIIRRKTFREDLYYRLCVLQITLPPLRERREDIPQLVQGFLGDLARKDNATPRRMSEFALRVLMRYHWPGNVRELENTVQNAAVLCDGDEIDVESLRQKEELFAGTPPLLRKEKQSLREAELELRKHLIREALRESGGNVSAAARALKVDRNLLTRWARQYGLRTGEK